MTIVRILLLLLFSVVNAPAVWAQQYSPEERQALSKTNPELLEDSDGDGIPSGLDRCPNEAGSSGSGGCPETAAVVKPTPTTNTLTNWKTAVDSLRQACYAALDRASTADDTKAAVQRFGDAVRTGLGITSGGGLEYAIAPLMQTRGIGHPDLADLIAITWNNTTGYPFSAALNVLPAAEQELILQRRKVAYEAARPVATMPPAAGVPKGQDSAKEVPEPGKFRADMLVRYNGRFYVIDWVNYIDSKYYLRGAYPETRKQTLMVEGHSMLRAENWSDKALPAFVTRLPYGEQTCPRCEGSGKIQLKEEIDRGGTNGIGGTNYTLTTPAYKEAIWRMVNCDRCFGTGKKR